MADRHLLITPGEPAGIGPDILLQWADRHLSEVDSCITVIADPGMLAARAESLSLTPELHSIDKLDEAGRGVINVLPCRLRDKALAGKPNPLNAAYVLETLQRAAGLCLSGAAGAMVTGPVQKSVINEGGHRFTGHTEFLAELCSQATGEKVEPVMMLATPGLRVALVTTHLPLREVSAHITEEKLLHCLRTLYLALQNDFAIARPCILVTGLNPHAGEEGHLGREEIEVIEPVLAECRDQGMDVKGPLPADTLFTPKHLQQADAVLAMYHDQGLPVLKHAGFGKAVNITLGLPIVRTSVDHGTALELAGSGQSDFGSLAYAIEMADKISQHRRQAPNRMTS